MSDAADWMRMSEVKGSEGRDVDEGDIFAADKEGYVDGSFFAASILKGDLYCKVYKMVALKMVWMNGGIFGYSPTYIDLHYTHIHICMHDVMNEHDLMLSVNENMYEQSVMEWEWNGFASPSCCCSRGHHQPYNKPRHPTK
jgi:hypothetical protein